VGTDLEAAQDAARRTGLAILSTLDDVLGDLDHVAQIVVVGMVKVAPGFDQLPAAIDGCSKLFVDVFGDRGRHHPRSAVGVAELPFGMPAEIELVARVAAGTRPEIPSGRNRHTLNRNLYLPPCRLAAQPNIPCLLG
jgi:hypothetical protein